MWLLKCLAPQKNSVLDIHRVKIMYNADFKKLYINKTDSLTIPVKLFLYKACNYRKCIFNECSQKNHFIRQNVFKKFQHIYKTHISFFFHDF